MIFQFILYKMLTLQNILSKNGKEFVDGLLNSRVVVKEKLNAATLSFQKNQSSNLDEDPEISFYFYKGHNNNVITKIDSVISTFFRGAIDHINTVGSFIMDNIPTKYTFVCAYFPSHQPSFISYSVLPKNNLVLTHIFDGDTIIDDEDTLKSWADTFEIAYMKPFFDGYLSNYQKEKLNDYMNGHVVFGSDDSFSKFIITLLNPDMKSSMCQNDFSSPVDCFVFTFFNENGKSKPTTAKLVDPYMSELIAKKKAANGYKDNTDILISDFSLFLSNVDLNDYILTAKTKEDRYLELFYKLFNKYIKYKKDQLDDFDVDTNEVVKESINKEFDIDFDNIENETTKKILKENPTFKNIFKTLLGSFQRQRAEDYKSIVMSPGVVRLFNDLVTKIDSKIDKTTDVKGNLTFDDYLNTISVKNIEDLDYKNAPKEVQDAVESNMQQVGDVDTPAMSFSEYLKKYEPSEEQKKEDAAEKREESIEDMIKKMEDKLSDIKKAVSKSSEELKDTKDDIKKEVGDIKDKVDDVKKETEKESKEKDKKDDKKEEESKKEENKGDKKEKKEENKEDNKDEGDSDSESENKEDNKDEGDSEKETDSNDEKSKKEDSSNDNNALGDL